MGEIKGIKIVPLGDSRFVKPYSIIYSEDGVDKRWDCVEAHDSVSAVLYHKQKDAFLFVKQFRPSLWHYQHKNGILSGEPGYTYELCAGIMDKGLGEERTIIEEILEETGYKASSITRITASYTALGFAANRQTLFWAAIDESMKSSSGGGVDGEKIELVFVPKSDIEAFLYDENRVKAPNLMFAINWFLANVSLI